MYFIFIKIKKINKNNAFYTKFAIYNIKINFYRL